MVLEIKIDFNRKIIVIFGFNVNYKYWFIREKIE